jgi:hypothetical protein
MGFAEPHGHVGRQHRRCAMRVRRDLIAETTMWLREAGRLPNRSLDHSAAVFPDRLLSPTRPLRLRVATDPRALPSV